MIRKVSFFLIAIYIFFGAIVAETEGQTQAAPSSPELTTSTEVVSKSNYSQENKRDFSWLLIVTTLILVITSGSATVYFVNRKGVTESANNDFEILED